MSKKPFTDPKIKISKITEKLDPNSFSMKNLKFAEKFPNSNVNAQTHHKWIIKKSYLFLSFPNKNYYLKLPIEFWIYL